MNAILETGLNGVYCGAVASVLCILYREHRLLTLSAAGWACLGGWAGLGIMFRSPPLSGFGGLWLAGCLLLTFGWLAFSLRFRPNLIAAHPTLYLFLGLACHLVITAGGGNVIPASVGVTLPEALFAALGTRGFDVPFQICMCILTVVISHEVLKSRWFARHCILFRRAKSVASRRFPNAICWSIAGLLLLQLLLLLGLGAASIKSHQGSFGAVPKYMAISAIAAISTYGKPWKAFSAAVFISWLEMTIYFVWPNSTVAATLSLLAYVVGAIVVVRPVVGISLAVPNPWLNTFVSGSAGLMWDLCFIIAVPLGLWGIWTTLGLSESRLLSITSVLAFSCLTYCSMKCSGTATATLPAFGACMAYVLTNATFSYSLASILILMWMAALGYLYFVRFASQRISLVTDLVILFSLHEVLGLSDVSGPDATLHFRRLLAFGQHLSFAETFLKAYVLFITVALCSHWVQVSSQGRALARSLSDPLLARQNRRNPVVALGVFSTVFLGVALLMQVLQCEHIGSISPNIADPQVGIAALLVGYVMASSSPSRGLVVALVYLLPEDLMPLLGISSIGEFGRMLLLFPIVFVIYISPTIDLEVPVDDDRT